MLRDLFLLILGALLFCLGRYGGSHRTHLQYLKGCSAGWIAAEKRYAKVRNSRGQFVKR